MRDFNVRGRSAAMAANGMAATSHPLATLTALDVLRAGGNAVDAAVAAGALLGGVGPPHTRIRGGFFFLFIRRGGGEGIAPDRPGMGAAGPQPQHPPQAKIP